MKIYEELQVITSRLVKHRCDLCGAESKCCGWTARSYDVAETEIKVLIKQKEGEITLKVVGVQSTT